MVPRLEREYLNRTEPNNDTTRREAGRPGSLCFLFFSSHPLSHPLHRKPEHDNNHDPGTQRRQRDRPVVGVVLRGDSDGPVVPEVALLGPDLTAVAGEDGCVVRWGGN